MNQEFHFCFQQTAKIGRSRQLCLALFVPLFLWLKSWLIQLVSSCFTISAKVNNLVCKVKMEQIPHISHIRTKIAISSNRLHVFSFPYMIAMFTFCPLVLNLHSHWTFKPPTKVLLCFVSMYFRSKSVRSGSGNLVQMINPFILPVISLCCSGFGGALRINPIIHNWKYETRLNHKIIKVILLHAWPTTVLAGQG